MDVVPLVDAVGHAAEDPAVDALLVSSETLSGAAAVHDARERIRRQREMRGCDDNDENDGAGSANASDGGGGGGGGGGGSGDAFSGGDSAPLYPPLTTVVLRRTQHASLSSSQLRMAQGGRR